MAGKIQWKDDVVPPKRRRNKPHVQFTGNRPARVKRDKLIMSSEPVTYPQVHWSRQGKVVPQTGHCDVGTLLVTQMELYVPQDIHNEYEMKYPVISSGRWYHDYDSEVIIARNTIMTYMGVYKKKATYHGRLAEYTWDLVLYDSSLYCIGNSLNIITEILE